MTAEELFDLIKSGEVEFEKVRETKNFVFYKVSETTIRVHISQAIQKNSKIIVDATRLIG